VFLGFFTQGANLCFAVGQVAYKYLLKSTPELESTPKHTILIVFYWCVLVALIAFSIWLNRKDANYISSVGILIYLGAVAQVQVIFLEQRCY
jgi:drug/metabolite transporter (DMT)-like permease